MIEKILSEIEELKKCDICKGMSCAECEHRYRDRDCDKNVQKLVVDKCKEIVQEVAKEYASPSILIDTEDARKLEEMMREVKHMKVMPMQTDGGWIPCSERLPDTELTNEVLEVTMFHPHRNESMRDVAYFYEGKWYRPETDKEPPYEVIAWKEPSAPYQKGEQKKGYDEEKCRTARNFAACADGSCRDDCNMQCPNERGEPHE